MMGFEKQSYLLHPQESKLWIMMFVCIAGIRVLCDLTDAHVLSNPLFENCTMRSEVWSMPELQCSMEIDLLCEHPYRFTNCVDEFGYTLMPFLDASPDPHYFISSDEVTYPHWNNCTLILRNKALDATISNYSVVEREKRILMKVMTNAILKLRSNLSNKSDDVNHRFVEYFFRRFFCLFGYPDKDLQPGGIMWDLPTQSRFIMSDLSLWTPQEFFRLLKLSMQEAEIRFLADSDDSLVGKEKTSQNGAAVMTVPVEGRPNENDCAVDFAKLCTSVEQGLEDLVFQSSNPGEAVCARTSINETNIQSTQQEFLWLESPATFSDCILQFYRNGQPILTESCIRAIDDVPVKICDLYLEDPSLEDDSLFLVLSHITFFFVNLASCLVLFALFTSKQRLERKMDRGRQRLEQELNDPFLRRVLEYKAEKSQEWEGRDLVPLLEAKIGTWDSKAATSTLLCRYFNYFRMMNIFTMFLTTIAYLLLHIFHVSSMPRYLEIMLMSIAMMLVSYLPRREDDTTVSSRIVNVELSATETLQHSLDNDCCADGAKSEECPEELGRSWFEGFTL